MAEATIQAAHRKLLSVLSSSSILHLGHGLLTTLIGVRMSEEGFGAVAIGLIASAFYVGGVIGAQLCSRIIKRVGHIRAFGIFSVLAATSTLAHVLVLAPPAWMLIRAVGGLSVYGLNLTSESWLNATVTRAIRGRVLATYTILVFLALSVGQFLLNVADPEAGDLFIISSMAFGLALIPIALTRIPSPQSLTSEHFSLRRIYRISPLALAGSLTSGMAIGSFMSLGSVYATKIGFTTLETSLFMASGILGGLLCQWPIGWLSDRYDRRSVILTTAFGTAVTALLVGYLGYISFGALLALTLLHGGLLVALYPLSLAYGNDFMETDAQFVELSRGLLLAYFIGAMIAPFLGSLLMDPLGPIGLFSAIAAIAIGLVGFGIYRRYRRRSVPLEEQEAFQTYSPYSSTEVYGLDPRYGEAPSTEPRTGDSGEK